MKILVPILLLMLLSACASKPKMTYCDLVTEEPTESISVKSKRIKRAAASDAVNERKSQQAR
jgi:uncharacterized lipoprotein YmbA